MTPLLFVALCCGADADAGGSYLYQPAYCLDDARRTPARPYVPQPGDFMLATDNKIFWKITHNLAGTGHPHHTGVVFTKPDGCLAVLEAGPHDTIYIRNLDWYPHFRCYEDKGLIWVRQRKVPLTPEQSACLTEFAMAQEGKFFAIFRLGKQLTPFRSRGPLRTAFVGKPQGADRRWYFCSELALEALVWAGTIDAETTRPSATYPRDIFFDRSPNPYINKHPSLRDCWYPPARWTSCPSQCTTAPDATPVDAKVPADMPPQ